LAELTFHEQAVLWGQAYEVLVKRGAVACLIEHGLVMSDRPGLAPWRQDKLLEVSKALSRELGLLDERERDVVKAAVQHMALTAFGVGYTATRAYVQSVRARTPKNPDSWKVKALWCPLLLPGGSTADEEARTATRDAFYKEMGLTGIVDPYWSRKGQPANADFLLWLSNGKEDCLLVQEYSYDMAARLGDFRGQEAHLDELTRHRRIVDSRSVFARVAAEVDGELFELSNDMKTFLTALTSDNKPLYKLCQASSYGEAAVRLLQRLELLSGPCQVRALAITPNGLESLSARFVAGTGDDARCNLMAQLGAAYREARKVSDGDEAALEAQVAAVFRNLLRKLPSALRAKMKGLEKMPSPGQDYVFEFEETLPEFANPMDHFTLDQALALVDDSPELHGYFGRPAPEAIGTALNAFARGADTLTLRDMHAAAVVAGLECAKPGKLNVIALEGNPGIGKTTAIRKHLGNKSDGYLFLYVSPRVVINRDVTESLARTADKEPSGILTVTTNAQLISAAERWFAKLVEAGKETKRHISGAVVADGVRDLIKPIGSMLVLDPADEHAIDAEHAGSRIRKDTLSEHEDLVREKQLTGVLSGMASTAKELLELNPLVNRIVLTAALQGFRERANQKTTIDALSNLFVSKAETAAGREERRRFAQRMPTIVVMVDELAGDGAGAPFVHAVAAWLNNEFIECFEDEPSPFTVILVVSDASLGNEVVLSRYLNAGNRTPDKVLVSHSAGKTPFRVAATKVKIGLGSARHDTLHVMTNSFPASELHVRYRVKLSSVEIEESQKKPGELETPREAVRRVADEAVLNGAKKEIVNALAAGARQVIYFAQDKLFLRSLKHALVDDEELTKENVQVLDSSVPGWIRKKLVEPATRDSVRVFLMTSSGARGVSFPLTDWIVASVPRFNVEAALMEIAQLVYRGRGSYPGPDGKPLSGDKVPRHLVMLVDDYVVSEEGRDMRQWLRQSIDLMTLLVMLRSTILTRITGDSDLSQPLALVPVGAVGLEELVSLMSQYVAQFVKEAEVFKGGSSKKATGGRPKDKETRSAHDELLALVMQAKANVEEIFSRTRLHGVAKRGQDGRSAVKDDYVKQLMDVAASPISSLLCYSQQAKSLPDHVHFSGPVVVETWEGFEKQEVFSFEGHETEVTRASRRLLAQLYSIDEHRELPSALRIPAKNLQRLLQRDQHEAANEFRTLKELKSPNTWIAVPAGRHQFMYSDEEDQDRGFTVFDAPLWQEALGRTLNAGSAVMPPLPKYESFPWAAAVGEVSPLKLDLAFDDRYFMASNELNLLNTLLLAADATETR
jgi:hypothetical protein